MNLSFRQLRAFLAVADCGSFTQAARRLQVTQSALSLLVKDLEGELGLRLLDRTTRRVELSDAGREFQPMAQKVLDDVQAVVRNAREVATLARGVVRIAATEAIASTLVVPAIAEYRRRRPAIEVRLHDTLVHTMLVPLRSAEVDYVVGPASLATAGLDSSISARPLFESPFACFCPSGHPLQRQDRVAWRELLKHPLIVPAHDFASRVLPELRRHLGEKSLGDAAALGLAQTRQVSNLTTGMCLAAAGLGAMIAPRYLEPLARRFGLDGRALVRPTMNRVVTLYTRRSHALAPAAQDFLEWLDELIVQQARGGAQ